MRGRLLGPDDVREAATYPRAVISEQFWKRAFGRNDAVVGQTIVVRGIGVTVIGVAPPGFVGLWTDSGPDLWLPLTLQSALGYDSNVSSYTGADRRTSRALPPNNA